MNAAASTPTAEAPDNAFFVSNRPTGLQCAVIAEIPASAGVTFTVATIAGKLRKSRQAISDRLSSVPYDEEKPVQNKPTRHWRLSSLPSVLREELEQAARVGGYRNAASMLSAPCLEWQPPLPLVQCSDGCIAQTRQLREALSQALELRDNPLVTPARLVEIGLADYARAFGHAITGRHWQNLFSRTIQRAGQAQNFEPLELYLPERPQRRPEPATAKPEKNFPHLKQLIESFAAPASPTGEEENSLWDAAFVLLSECSDTAATKRALLAFLHTHAPSLASNANALRVSFDRKYGKWLAQGQTLAALDDGRATREQEKPVLIETERLSLLHYCSKLENVSLGWRKFLGSLEPEHGLRFRYRQSSDARPRVPDWVRKLVTKDAQNLGPYIRGPRTAKLAGAYIERDPNALAAGDSDQCDDLTLPLVWFERTPEVFIGQGQLLLWMDERSWLIQSLDLISDGAYTGFSIRNSWTKKAELHGLPRRKIHVEMGIWRSAKVFVGSREQVGTKHTELGLRRLGIRFHHSTLPRGKVIERHFGSFQDLMQMTSGYLGRCRMLDKYESAEKQIKLVRSGEAEPEQFFYEKREILKVLEQLCCELNTTPKHGKYHDGLSPLEVFQKTFTTPLVKIPPELRHLLADNIIDTTVGRNGVGFRYGTRTYRYKNSVELGRLKGEKVRAWFSPENPDWCSITDLQGGNPIVVPLEPLVPCDGATADQMAMAYESNANFDRYYKDTHRAIRSAFPPEFEQRRFRQVIADEKALELGRQITEQTAALETERREQQTVKVRTHRKARELGISPAALVDDPQRANRGMELIERARRKHEQQEKGGGQ